MIGEKTLEPLKQILVESSYTVATCGSGMMEEEGILGFKQEGRAYEIEQKYSKSPEELSHISCLSRRSERFYEFYREEMLEKIPDMTPSVRALTRMEGDDKLQCIVVTNIFDLPEQVDCRDMIYLHGSIYKGRCPHRGRLYSMEGTRNSRYIPHCKNYKTMIHPGTSPYGEMVGSSIMNCTTEEIARADMLPVLGTNLRSEVYSNYIRYFQGRKMIIIHRIPRPLDKEADTTVHDFPQNVLPLLMDGGI